MTRQELVDAGVKIVIYPNTLTRVAVKSCQKILEELKNTGTTMGGRGDMLDHKEIWKLFDDKMWLDLESKYTYIPRKEADQNET